MALPHQYNLPLIQHEFNDSIIEQRAHDGYINATALCQVAGKRWYNYLREETTGRFLRLLESKVPAGEVELIQELPSSSGQASVWVHPKVAVHLAQWVSADFAVQVSEWVYDWFTGTAKAPSAHPPALPHHLQRYIRNDAAIAPGHFSILQETGLSLFGPLYNLGFEIPKGWVPDISVGKMFCAWLREKFGVDTNSLPTYHHDYLDGRVVEANMYPDEYLAEFRRWFRNEWLPVYGVRYFKRKDPSSLVFIDRLPALASPSRPSLPR